MKYNLLKSFLLAAAISAGPASAVTHQVYNATDFNNLPSLNAGDVVLMHAGNYGALIKTINSNISDDTTAQTDPILIVAATPGSVVVTEPSRILLHGRGIILAGLDFSSTSGMLDNVSSPAYIIRFDIDSRYCALIDTRFDKCKEGAIYGNWVMGSGFNHTVEYCSFYGEVDVPVDEDPHHEGRMVNFTRSTAEAGITTPRNHRIRYNYFGPRDASLGKNGWETIRIGDSGSQAHDMSVTVERNVFYRSIWRGTLTPNDMEIISNKSKGNKYLNNVFLESAGQLTLRHGDACVVDGNFFFGSGSYSGSSIVLGAANILQGGVRIIGQDNIVRNNYFINLGGTGARSALVLLAGDPNFYDGNGSNGHDTYEPAHNAQIYNNTFIDCFAMNLGFIASGSTQPTGVQIYNNAWQHGSGSSDGIVRNSSFTPSGSGGNYIYSHNGSFGWTGLGDETVSPLITESFDNYKRPTSGSPLLNAVNTTLVSTTDIRGLNRPATASQRDIGSYEREVSGSGARPLLRNEVGAIFDGGPSGTYPTPGVFQMNSNQVVMDAENFTSATLAGGKTWSLLTESGAAGGSTNNIMQALPSTGAMPNPGSSSPRIEYDIFVPAGSASTFRVHVRGRGPTGSDDSVHVSIDGNTSTFSTLPLPVGGAGSFGWVTSSSLSIPSGTHKITVWMRDDGSIIDKLVVNTSATAPTGTGPSESPRI